MTQETLKRANELTGMINRATQEIESLRKVEIRDGMFIGIASKSSFSTNAELLKQIVNMAVDYKLKQIGEWGNELKEL